MAEALAFAGSIFAVIQITENVVSLCYKLTKTVTKVKGARKEISHMISTVSALQGVLKYIHNQLQAP
jgi:hypothetical protein